MYGQTAISLRSLRYEPPSPDYPRVVLDFETNEGAVDGNLTNVWCLVLYFPDTQSYLSYEEDEFPGSIQSIQDILDTHCAVIHNAQFDVWVAAQIGLKIECYECTQLLAYLWNPSNPTGLKAQAEYLGLSHQKTEYSDFSNFTPEMLEYCLNDCLTTWDVYCAYKSFGALEDEGFQFLYYEMELPFILVLMEMTHNGVAVNLDRWDEIIADVTAEHKKILDEIHEIAPLAPCKKMKTKNLRDSSVVVGEGEPLELGKFWYVGYLPDTEQHEYLKIEVYNPNSQNQTAWLLKNLYSWESPEKTDNGSPKLDRAVLSECPHTLAQLLCEYSKLNKIITTYGNSLKEKVKDGRLYCNLNQCVTLTGRLSSSSPNLQNIPSRGEIGDSIRDLFIADGDRVLVGCDVDSFQVRILCYYLNAILGDYYEDASILYNSFCDDPDTDPHQVRADIIGCERKVAKNCLFGDLFGFGVAKFAAMSKLSIPQAQQILKDQRDKNPSIQALKEKVWEYTRLNKGVIRDLFGRRGVYPHINSKDKGEASRAERQSFNFLIQATEASIIKLWLNVIRMKLQTEGLDDVSLLLQVHDEILLESSIADAAKAASIVQYALQTPKYLGELPVTGTPVIGKTWREVHG